MFRAPRGAARPCAGHRRAAGAATGRRFGATGCRVIGERQAAPWPEARHDQVQGMGERQAAPWPAVCRDKVHGIGERQAVPWPAVRHDQVQVIGERQGCDLAGGAARLGAG
jgi:hypothetical protein